MVQHGGVAAHPRAHQDDGREGEGAAALRRAGHRLGDRERRLAQARDVLLGAVAAKEWAERQNLAALAFGALSFLVLFWVYASSLRYAELAVVTMGWIVLLQVGIALEERDIADLTAMIEDSSVADVDAVLSRLLAASEHHLAAFTAAAESTLPTEPGQGMQNQNGPGMQNGRQNENGPGMQGRGPGQGPRQGDQRQGPGRAPGPQGQAQGEHDCYLTDDTDADDTTG